VLVVVQIELANLNFEIREGIAKERANCYTLRLMQSASTLASAQRLVRGGRMAVEPNIVSKLE
jgi:hypothetical protein